MTRPVVQCQACKTCSCGCKGKCGCGTDCATGKAEMSRTSLATPHLSFSYAYSNLMTDGTGGSAANPNFGMGTNIIASNFAYATEDGDNIAFIWGPDRAVWFPSEGGAALYGSRLLSPAP